MGKSRWGGELFGLALALTLPGQSLGVVCWLLGSVIGSGGVLWVLDLLPQVFRPPTLKSIYLMSLPSHMVYPPPAYVFILIHFGPLLNFKGSSLLSLSQFSLLPPLAFLLFPLPLPLFFLPHQNTPY